MSFPGGREMTKKAGFSDESGLLLPHLGQPFDLWLSSCSCTWPTVTSVTASTFPTDNTKNGGPATTQHDSEFH